MPIDPKGRRIIADAIDAFLLGKIDSWALDDAADSLATDDMMCRRIGRCLEALRRCYNKGKDALPREFEERLRRWEYLLRSSVEWSEICPTPRRSNWSVRVWNYFRGSLAGSFRLNPKFKIKPEDMYWPFADAAAWETFLFTHRTEVQQ